MSGRKAPVTDWKKGDEIEPKVSGSDGEFSLKNIESGKRYILEETHTAPGYVILKGLLPTVLDVTKNPHEFKFVELEASQMVRAIQDSDLSVVVTNYAVESGLVLG